MDNNNTTSPVCRNCEYCKMGLDMSEYVAKCMKTSKRGKTITWAMTLVFPTVPGEDRVKEKMGKQTIAPFWCPIRKEVKKESEKIQ